MSTARAVVAIAGDDVYEDLFGVGAELQQLLAATGIAGALRMGMGWLDGADVPDLIVLYAAMGGYSAARVARLVSLVETGTGLIVVHSSAVFPTADGHPVPPHDALFELFGVRYESHGPQPHSSRFEVRLDEHPVTARVVPFTIEHEHYRLEITPSTRVVAYRETAVGREPIVTVRDEGDGRICFLQLGHDMRSMREPAVRRLIENAAAWASKTSIARKVR